MSHLRNIKIKFANVTEMKAVRAVLEEFGYPIFQPFAESNSVEQYDCAHVENTTRATSVARGKVYAEHEKAEVMTLAEFIARQAAPVAPVKTPAQVELEKLEASAAALNKQIAALKATI